MITLKGNSAIYECVSTDSKPTTGIDVNTLLHELDTDKWYYFKANNTWGEVPNTGGGGSSFEPTQSQLDAMNSGATTEKINQISTNESNILLGNIATNNAYTNVAESTEGVLLVKAKIVDSTTGNIAEGNFTRATHYTLLSDVSSITVGNNDYECAVYCYNKDTGAYVGRITTDNTVSTSGTIRYGNSFDVANFNYSYRLQVRRKDNAQITVSDVQTSIVITIKPHTTVSGQYIMLGSPDIYTPTAITGENIDNISVSDIYTAYDGLVTSYPDWLSRDVDIGLDSDNTAIRAYTMRWYMPIVRNNESAYTIYDDVFESNTDIKHILICSGVHGDEKTSVIGVKNLITELLTSSDDWAQYIRSNFVIHIVPILNPWGFDNFSRNNKDGININRDYDDFETSEARAMRDYIAKFGDNLKVIIDSHNTNLDMPYIGTKETFRNYNLYARSAIQIAGAASTYLSTVYSADKKPYFYTWLTSNSDTLNVYGNELGKITVTVETPRNYSGGSTNNSEVTPLVQAVIANLIQIYGQAKQ